ncbi:MAG: alanine racemase [Acidimicrobiales bacterium]
MAEGAHRPAWVEVDLGAIEHNAAVLAAVAAPARLCAVVKADAYGHGAVEVAAAALAGGARELAVALVDEGIELRQAGIEAPILLLSEPSADAMAEVYANGLVPTVYSVDGLALASKAAQARATETRPGPAAVEVKVDTGMHRVGLDPADLVPLVRALVDRPELEFSGLWTHLAVADEPDNSFTTEQLERFEAARSSLPAAGLPPPRRVHAANTAGAIAWPGGRLDMVRCGIGLYGYAPSPALWPALASVTTAAGWSEGLRPALSFVARVSFVRQLGTGERVSYGLKAPLHARSLVATIPLGYADGIPRSYFTGGGEVLVNGRRRRLAGVVTMDQILVDCRDDFTVSPGDEVVLIGEQGEERLTAEDWARSLDTICYEVVTRIGPRVPRIYRSRRPSESAVRGRDMGDGAGGR